MNSLVGDWPAGSAAAVVRLVGGAPVIVESSGDLAVRRPWASVSKAVVALAMGVEVDSGRHAFAEHAGPGDATLAHLLSHSAGLGLEAGDAVMPVGTRRIYSNVGIDAAVAHVVDGADPAEWLNDRVLAPLGLTATRLEGRPAAGLVGSTEDLARLAGAWLGPTLLAPATRDLIVTPFLPLLEGFVPGWGRFRPCPWGLGVEVRGDKRHWMGEWPPESFGHFGQSGSLVLVNGAARIAVVATSSEPFGPWARDLWPRWTTAVFERNRSE